MQFLFPMNRLPIKREKRRERGREGEREREERNIKR